MKEIRMSSRLGLFISLVIVFLTSVVRAELVTTYSVHSKTVKGIEEWVDKDTMIFIEIDDVIAMPQSKMFSYDLNPYRMFISNLVTLGDRTPAYNKAIASWYAQRKIRLVEGGWVDFIKRAKEKGAKIYGLHSMPLYLLNIDQKTFKELSDLGIVFDNQINGKSEFVIKKEGAWFSRFGNGIIYTGPYNKTNTILELIKNENLSPQKIVTFGHIKSDVKAVDKTLKRFNMYFKSVIYKGAREVAGRPDAEIVKFQQRELIEHGKWYEDEEASKLLDFRRRKSVESAESK